MSSKLEVINENALLGRNFHLYNNIRYRCLNNSNCLCANGYIDEINREWPQKIPGEHALKRSFRPIIKRSTAPKLHYYGFKKDIVTAVDKSSSVVLLVLDLSATFDSVDHGIILSRLSTPFGVKVTVLGWLKSNLTSRTQFISVNNSRLSQRLFKRGFPQGSVLGPLLYRLYTQSPFADIVKSYNLDYNYYADDTQHYLPFSVICSFYEMATCKSLTEIVSAISITTGKN